MIACASKLIGGAGICRKFGKVNSVKVLLVQDYPQLGFEG